VLPACADGNLNLLEDDTYRHSPKMPTNSAVVGYGDFVRNVEGLKAKRTISLNIIQSILPKSSIPCRMNPSFPNQFQNVAKEKPPWWGVFLKIVT